jgi:hypothetical protein
MSFLCSSSTNFEPIDDKFSILIETENDESSAYSSAGTVPSYFRSCLRTKADDEFLMVSLSIFQPRSFS